jgi:hypothetical protein
MSIDGETLFLRAAVRREDTKDHSSNLRLFPIASDEPEHVSPRYVVTRRNVSHARAVATLDDISQYFS